MLGSGNTIMNELDKELEEIKMTQKHEASLLASNLISVVRDQAISSLYGYSCSLEGVSSLPAERIFVNDFASRIARAL